MGLYLQNRGFRVDQAKQSRRFTVLGNGLLDKKQRRAVPAGNSWTPKTGVEQGAPGGCLSFGRAQQKAGRGPNAH